MADQEWPIHQHRGVAGNQGHWGTYVRRNLAVRPCVMQHRSGRFRRFVAEEMSGGMGEERRPDLRLLVPALAVWAGALTGTSLSARAAVLVAAAVVAMTAGVAWRGGGPRLVALAALSCFVISTASGMARIVSLDRGPVAALAEVRAHVTAHAVLIEDPVVRSRVTGRTQNYVVA